MVLGALQALTHLKHFFILLLMNNFDDHSALFYLHDTISNKLITNHARKDQFYIWIWEY